MDKEEMRKYAIEAVRMRQGDDFLRVKFELQGFTPAEMTTPYYYTGKTKAEVLAEYEAKDRRCEDTIAWLRSLTLEA